MRTRGSARFDPYYKVQVWDPRTLAWRDIQRAYPSQWAAASTMLADPRRWRIMCITPEGRYPLPQ